MNIFKEIIAGNIPCAKLYEDERCIVIKDINPVAAVHCLIIPLKELRSLADMQEQDSALLGHLLWVAHQIAQQLNLETGYRVVINTGADSLQSVDHLHIHLLGGRLFSWPPG